MEVGELGTAIARFEAEVWCELHEFAGVAVPLRAVCLIERNHVGDTEIEPCSQDLLSVLPHTLGVRGTPAGTPDRFTFYCDLVRQVPVFRLRAGLAAPAPELADAVQTAVQQASMEVVR
jgi:hypothetical protein